MSEPTPPPYRGPIAWMAQNHVASNVLMALLILGGLASLFTRMQFEVFPEVDIDTVLVNVVYPGASPTEIEQGVVLAIEEEVRGLDGVKEVRSTAVEGSAIVAIDLLLGADPDRALNDVKSAVDRITSFPAEAERPIISLVNTRNEVVTVIFYGDADEATLRKLADRARSELASRKGITLVEVAGVRPLEVSVEIPQEKLRAHRLTLEEVASAIRLANIDLPAGEVKTAAGQILLRTQERKDFGREFGEVVIRANPDGSKLRVRDVAKVVDGFREEDYRSEFNGKTASMVRVFRVGSESPTSVSDEVRAYLDEIRDELPPTVQVATWIDWSDMYRDRIGLLKRNAYLGLVLVLVILGLFLEPRLAFWVTLGIPISFAGSLLFLPGADVSINMISVFGFIVTLGMVVDDAIVVGEAVYARRQQGLSLLEAAIAGTREVAVPVTFSILTTCVAFAPMLFVPGLMGKFFRVVPVVVISVLLLSLTESLFILPAHLSHKMPKPVELLLWPFIKVMGLFRAEKVSQGLETFVEKIYRPFLVKILEYRYVTLSAGIALLVVTAGLVAGGRVEFTFFPKIEGDVVIARLRMPIGTPVEVTERHHERLIRTAQEILDELLAEGDGENGVLSRGIRSELGASSMFDSNVERDAGNRGSHLSTVMVYLSPPETRRITTSQFAHRWRERVGDIPGAETLSFDFNVGANPGAPIDIRLSHADTEILDLAAEELAERLRRFNGVFDIDSGVATGKRQFDLELTPLGRAHGLTETMLAQQIRGAFYGLEAVRQQRGRDEVRVYVRRPLEERMSLGDIRSFVVQTPGGGEIPLVEAAHIEPGRAYTAIRRVDGRRTVSVTADVVEGVANANKVVAAVLAEDMPKLLEKYPRLSYSLGGAQQQQSESLTTLLGGYVLALFAMYGLLAIIFRRYLQPVLIMSAIPFGLVGAVGGHLFMGYDMSLMSMMGLVALSGVVVNDSIVLVDYVNTKRAEGLPTWDAVIVGSTRRFRPILLTSLTTFFGLAPMILETSVQARFLIPMALSLGFGVMFATVIILIFVPAGYLALEDFHAKLAFFGSPDPGPRMPTDEPSPAGSGDIG